MPRYALRVLRWIVRGTDAIVVEAELTESFRERVTRHGPGTARWWYRRQVAGFVLRALAVKRLSLRTNGGGGMGWTQGLWADVRWAIRGLRKRPTFTTVAVATLALGIGANSAVFTLVSAHFLTPLPYDRPDELVVLWETGRNTQEVTTVAPGNYWRWRDDASSFVDIAAFNVDFATLSGDDAAERVTASVVSPHFFDVLGATPQLGARFDEMSVRAASGRQVVLSHALWTRRYGADLGIVGTDIRIDGRPHTVVGVMPAAFRQPERSLSWQTTELWRPMLLDDQRDDHGSRYLRTVARRRPEVSVELARQEMATLAERLAAEFPEANAGRAVLVRTLDQYLLGTSKPTLMMLLAAGGTVLLIVCANVANLTLARGTERKREFALRAALGSGRRRLLRQVMVESVVLALIGAVLGAGVVIVGSDFLQSLQARYFSALIDVAVDWRVVGFTTAVALGAGVLFGLPLARSASRLELRGALIDGGARSGRGVSTNRTRGMLIIGQVGLATALLAVSVVLSRSFNELVSVPPGFEADGVVTLTVSAPSATYASEPEVIQYHRDVLSSLEALPGARDVGMVSDLMFTTENMGTTLRIDGLPYDPTNPPSAEYHVVLPEYFAVLQIPLLSGSFPDGWEEASGEIPVIVNEHMAEAVWPGGEAIGSTLELDWDPPLQLRVAGIVGNVLDDGYDAEPEPVLFVPFGRMPRRRMSYLIGVTGNAGELISQIRTAVSRVDPDIPASGLMLLEDMLSESVARPRAASLIGAVFALIALIVAGAGIYGVLSYSVQSRTREIGIRAALGADSQSLVAMIMGQTTRLMVLGLGIGVVGALAAGWAASGLLFGVRPWDPLSLALATFTLGLVGTVAAWLPARRATHVDPTMALRSE